MKVNCYKNNEQTALLLSEKNIYSNNNNNNNGVFLLLLVITFMQRADNYIPDTNLVSKAYRVSAILHLQSSSSCS